MEYEIEIASEPCLKCGGHDFEQFDLILYPMSIEVKQQILDGLKALEYDTLRRKENVELNLENQKLKESLTIAEAHVGRLVQENEELKEVSRQRGFTIADLQDHENTLNGQIRELKKKQCWKCGANQEYMTNK